jgi:nucleoside-diphosphate-sugar epimerase
MANNVLVTGGAGYIGSILVAALLRRGDHVTVLDDLWFGGESLLPFLAFDTFHLLKRDLCDERSLRGVMDGVDSVIHLAAIVGFPACDKAGRSFVWQLNVEGTKRVYRAAASASVSRMIFASSYSNYGESSHDELVTEESPLYPKSTYAESKIEAEQFLLAQQDPNQTAPICLRLATVFGVSPRTRFDLMANQFVLEAFTRNKLILYQEDFKRSFVQVRDVVRAIMLVMNAPLEQVRNQVFNVGSERLNTSKRDLVALIQARLPELEVEYRDTSFSGDMRSIHVSFEKLRRTLGYEVSIDLGQGIDELLWALRHGVISDPLSEKYRNHPPMMS